jgi:hypothetical protein
MTVRDHASRVSGMTHDGRLRRLGEAQVPLPRAGAHHNI